MTLRRLDLAAEIYHLREPQKIPLVMSPDEGVSGRLAISARPPNARGLSGTLALQLEQQRHRMGAGAVVLHVAMMPGARPRRFATERDRLRDRAALPDAAADLAPCTGPTAPDVRQIRPCSDMLGEEI